MRNKLIFLATALLLIASRNGGGSSTPTTEAQAILLGGRAAPGCLISVSRKGGDLGTSCQAHIRIQTDAGAPTPVAGTVWTATGADAPSPLNRKGAMRGQ